MTYGLEVALLIATFRVDVMDFKIMHFALLPLGFISTNCTSVVITPKHAFAVHEVHQAIFALIPE